MNPNETNETKEMIEEQEIARELFWTTHNILEQETIADWILGRRWEDALVPIRLPEGMSELFTQMNKARTTLEDGRCDRCESKAGCQLLLRNPSEIFLTNLLKLAFSALICGQQK